MTDVTDATTARRGPTPDDALRVADSRREPMLAADGTPLKRSLARALRREKLRALMLIAPLLLFILVTFIAPIADMLFRSVENQIVSDTLPRTTRALADWDGQDLPPEDAFAAMAYDLTEAAELKVHTRLGSRLNYEAPGISSLFRKSGRGTGDAGEALGEQFVTLDPAWENPMVWAELMAPPDWLEARAAHYADGGEPEGLPAFKLRDEADTILPETASVYGGFARITQFEDGDDPAEEDPWSPIYLALHRDLAADPPLGDWSGPHADLLAAAAEAAPAMETVPLVQQFEEIDEDWLDPDVWATIKTFSPPYTPGYFLNAVDMQQTPDGVELRPETQRIYVTLFLRTLVMSLAITGTCLLLGYPVAWLLANLPSGRANLLMILVLLPFWTSLLVRTSAWKVLLQQQGVINDTLVWIGLIADDKRLTLINNQTGTIIAMTHILLPFMILPLYSVMKTIPPSYLRAAKSLGATDWTAFWRVYFPQSVPGIGAGSILVFILAIGYYITPELVGGTSGVFISNRIAYHISSSLNWGLAAALGSILLFAVLILYWAYDRMVGIDNVKLGG
ncbi:ABC transporter permease [Roseitranquillus sediminis]|uniref:ABC transporter permease n=1 Tax=Roseitranquillus sediminis TaxID=2809051 RepID=UPI001D0C1FE3|nr:ABC transporter permease [Roseitranquillus sediminis]MBM9593367.1 ABC transporter permease [Roseitranquillus sediminis]